MRFSWWTWFSPEFAEGIFLKLKFFEIQAYKWLAEILCKFISC